MFSGIIAAIGQIKTITPREAGFRLHVDAGQLGLDDVNLGVGNHWNTQSYNLGRLTVHASNLPDTTGGFTLDRKCSSGLNAIALAARGIMCNEIDVAVAGGMESISLTLNGLERLQALGRLRVVADHGVVDDALDAVAREALRNSRQIACPD